MYVATSLFPKHIIIIHVVMDGGTEVWGEPHYENRNINNNNSQGTE